MASKTFKGTNRVNPKWIGAGENLAHIRVHGQILVPCKH